MTRILRFATFLAPNMLPVYRFVADYIGSQLGYQTELTKHPKHTPADIAAADVSFICGLPYVQLARQHPSLVEPLAAPVLRGKRYEGRPIYFSDVIVSRESSAKTFLDLRGRSWAYNEKASQSGYGITRYWLVKLGETQGFFSRVIAAGWHQKAIRMVCDGKVDAAAIDSQVLAIELRDQPELAPKLKVIEALGPSTIQPVVASQRLPDTLKADIQQALLAMDTDSLARQALAHGFVERFVAVTDTDYDDIRAMLRAAEAANFLTIR